MDETTERLEQARRQSQEAIQALRVELVALEELRQQKQSLLQQQMGAHQALGYAIEMLTRGGEPAAVPLGPGD